MRKETLLIKKKETIKDIVWYVRDIMTEDDLKSFSIAQLEKIVELVKMAEEFRSDHEAFCTISATEVIQKETGKIAYFESGGTVREESYEECMAGASSPALKKFLEEKEKA